VIKAIKPKAWVGLAILLAATGCKMLDSGRVVTPLASPSQWSQATDSADPVQPEKWVEDFEDDLLADLIHEGMKQNHDLRASMARIRRTLAIADAARARRRPTLDATLGGFRFMRNDPVTGRLPEPYSSRADLGLEASWEADVWNRLGQEAQAADFDAAASRDDLQTARLSLAVNIARIYCDVITSRHLQTLFADTEASFTRTLGVVEERFKRGITNALDVHLARANVGAAQSVKEQASGDIDFALRAGRICGRRAIGLMPD
jgi:outer membrane protein TolC